MLLYKAAKELPLKKLYLSIKRFDLLAKKSVNTNYCLSLCRDNDKKAVLQEKKTKIVANKVFPHQCEFTSDQRLSRDAADLRKGEIFCETKCRSTRGFPPPLTARAHQLVSTCSVDECTCSVHALAVIRQRAHSAYLGD